MEVQPSLGSPVIIFVIVSGTLLLLFIYWRREMRDLLMPGEPVHRQDAKADRARFVATQQEALNRAAAEEAQARATRHADQLRLRRTPQASPGARRATAPAPKEPQSDSVPENRVIARNAFSRFSTLDLSHPSMRVWIRLLKASGDPPVDFVRAFCYNKTQPDRVCPYCGIQYMPLPEGKRAATPGTEKIEEERRLSGICSRACFAKTGVSPDDHFGEVSERAIVSPGVLSTRRADGTIITTVVSNGGARSVVNIVEAGGFEARTTQQKCQRCSRANVKLLLCSACHQAAYCSAECQRQDRQNHKPLCRQGKQALAALESAEW